MGVNLPVEVLLRHYPYVVISQTFSGHFLKCDSFDYDWPKVWAKARPSDG